MKEAAKIAAVVVTYNRKDLLLECLEGIFKQTRIVDQIFLIDNASTDGTEALIPGLVADHPSIHYVRLTENTGSAGGFNEGIKLAHQQGFDWMWFLDDDVSPVSTCLEIMLSYEHVSQCIHPSKRDVNGNDFIWESVFNPATASATFFDNVSFKNGKEFTFVNMGCFEGMLIHKDIVSKIGYPDPRFFIVGDDVVYGFLASLHTNVIFTKNALLHKLIPFSTRSNPLFLYYAVRNQFLIKEYLKKLGMLNVFQFNLYFVPFVVYASIKQTVRNRSIKTIHFIARGLLDGYTKKFFKMK